MKIINKMPKEAKKYKKKPIAIRAMQVNESFNVKTLEGTFFGKAGDYLMEGVKGELYCCDREIFLETYERDI